MAAVDTAIQNNIDDQRVNNKSFEKNEAVTKCCGKPCAVNVCVNCFGVFHKSCSKRVHLTYLSKNTVICCKKNSEEGQDIPVAYSCEVTTASIDKLTTENLLLKRHQKWKTKMLF